MIHQHLKEKQGSLERPSTFLWGLSNTFETPAHMSSLIPFGDVDQLAWQ